MEEILKGFSRKSNEKGRGENYIFYVVNNGKIRTEKLDFFDADFEVLNETALKRSADLPLFSMIIWMYIKFRSR